jgi:thiol-disulfide isomerase/thioredoxin
VSDGGTRRESSAPLVKLQDLGCVPRAILASSVLLMALIMKKVLLILVFLAAVGAAVWFKFGGSVESAESLTFRSDAKYSSWVGKPAELDFVSMDGRRVTSADLRGKVVLLDFWATWCGPCMKSLDHLKQNYAQFREQGLEVVAINFDNDREAVEKVVAAKELSWPQYFEGRDNSVGRQFGITHYPSVWLVDKAGNVRYISALTDTETKIQTLLAESEEDALARTGRKHFLSRMVSGLASARKTAAEDTPVRARTAEEAAKEPKEAEQPVLSDAFLQKVSQFMKVNSVMISARPSAVIHNGEASRYVFAGEIISLNTSDGRVEFRVEKIEQAKVTLVEVKSGTQLVLSVVNR